MDRICGVHSEEFFVCEHHISTGGWESCCECSEDGICSESGECCCVQEDY